MLRRKLWIVAATVCMCTGTGNLMLASNLSALKMDDAVKSYQERKYSACLGQLKQLHSAGLCTDTVHYYMALCYQQLNQIAAAKQEYQTVANGKTANLKANAQVALNSLERWSQHRSYEGNGNVFSRYSSASSARRSPRSSPPPKEISFDIPITSTGGG